MDKSALFIHLSAQDSTTLLDLLSQAYDYEQFAATTAWLIKRDSHQSFADQAYPTTLRIANDTQKEHLEAKLQHLQIRTSK